MLITFSTCWYNFKSKFDNQTYLEWIDNILQNVNNYNLVIYSDEYSCHCLQKYLSNPRIKLIVKPHEEFYNYKYKDYWIHNHSKNVLINQRIEWQVNMLWSEKIHFVYETMHKKYFDTEYYGWCDIGYFRNTNNDTNISMLSNWPSDQKIEQLNKNKIYYACVNNNDNYIDELMRIISNKNDVGLPSIHIPPDQVSIAGGFFISHKDKIEWWKNTYDNKLKLYFENDYLVKDDQIIIADCVFSNVSEFYLCKEKSHFDNWFLFQRYLL
jgi:quinol monooxygenase YgiN